MNNKINCSHKPKKDLSQGLGDERHYYCPTCGSHWWKDKYYTEKEWDVFINKTNLLEATK